MPNTETIRIVWGAERKTGVFYLCRPYREFLFIHPNMANTLLVGEQFDHTKLSFANVSRIYSANLKSGRRLVKCH